MTDWTLIRDRGLGYLGLFLIGSLSWIADHLGPGRVPAPDSRHRADRSAEHGCQGAPVIGQAKTLRPRRAA